MSGLLCFVVVTSALAVDTASTRVFNVKDYGATGRKEDDARPAIQKAIQACAAAGGGTVLLPPGLYTSGTLRLRSHVRLQVEPGATLFASQDPKAYDCGPIPSKAALLYGEDIEDITITGQGIIDGQAEYDWRSDDFEQGFAHKDLMLRLGKPVLRSFPKDFPKREIYPHLVWLGRCKNVRFTDLSLLHAPSWTFALYDCVRATFDGLYIYTSLKEAVWADGIDLDGCRDVTVANCTIETGDDCVALVSNNVWGPARTCENVCVTNCRLSTASAGIKFSEGNRVAIRDIQVRHTLFNNVNRGFAFLTGMGGAISNILLADLTVNCSRFDWFWAGDGQLCRFMTARWSEMSQQPAQRDEPPPGRIRNITMRNIVAQTKGSSLFYGHSESWLEDVRLENVHLVLASDQTAPFDMAEHALDFRRVRNLKLHGVTVAWQRPVLAGWKGALNFEEVQGLEVDGFVGSGAWPRSECPAVALKQVTSALIRHCRATEASDLFLKISGPGTRGLRFEDNDFARAKTPWRLESDLLPGAVVGLNRE